MAHNRAMESTPGQTPAPGRVRVWDAPLRLFHWSFAATFTLAWLSRDDTHLDIHIFSGYLFAALLLFRLWWGWAGETHARFTDFLFPPARLRDWLAATLRGRPPRYLGHNPGGAWAVFSMLGLGALICITGLFALGGEEGHGPFAGMPDFEQGARMHEVHEWLAWLMLALTILHVTGVWLESRWHREHLAAAMISGYKPLRRAGDAGDARPRRAVAGAMRLPRGDDPEPPDGGP